MDNYKIDMTKDALFRGEFEVVKDLFAAFPDGEASKRMCDKVRDNTLKWLTKNNNFIFIENRSLIKMVHHQKALESNNSGRILQSQSSVMKLWMMLPR